MEYYVHFGVSLMTIVQMLYDVGHNFTLVKGSFSK